MCKIGHIKLEQSEKKTMKRPWYIGSCQTSLQSEPARIARVIKKSIGTQKVPAPWLAGLAGKTTSRHIQIRTVDCAIAEHALTEQCLRKPTLQCRSVRIPNTTHTNITKQRKRNSF